jgi:hypothetical protein
VGNEEGRVKRSHTIFIMPDTHFGLAGVSGNGGHDERAFRTALKAIEVLRPDEFIHLGDIGEWDSVSPWQFTRRKRPDLEITLERLDKDLKEVNVQFDRIQEALTEAGCTQRLLIEGNHEIWVRQMVSEVGLVADHYDLRKQLRLADRGFGWSPYGDYVKRGKLRLYHGGHYTSIHHAYQHATKCGASIGYGHTHDVQYVTVPSVEGPHLGVSFGCLCEMEKGFLKGRLTNWQHAFGVIYLQENGEFNVDIRRIEAGWTTINGREIRDGKLLAGRPRKETS